MGTSSSSYRRNGEIMQIINIIVLAFTSRLLGGAWNNEIPRRYIVSGLFGFIAAQCGFNILTLNFGDADWIQFFAIIWLFTVLRLLPTGHLLTAINGSPPTWRKSPFNFLYNYAFKIWRILPERLQTWEIWSIVYSILRASLALPAIVFLGGLAWLAFAQGIAYWICGQIDHKNGSKWAEILTGVIVAGCI